MMNGGYHHGGPPPPRLTNRGFEMNPSPHEIAIGSLEQWRRSKLSKAWKNVLVSLIKGPEGCLCIWRDAIGPDGSSYMELLQRVPFRDIQQAYQEGGILRVTLYYSAEEPLTFRCMDEPAAIQDWVTALRTVKQHMHGQPARPTQAAPSAARPAPQQQSRVASAPAAPAVDLLSHDVAHGQATPDLLMGNHGHAPQQQQRPVHYQTYPQAAPNAGFPQPPIQPLPHMQQPKMFGQHQPQPNNFAAFQQQQQRPGYPQQPQPQAGYPMQQPRPGQPQQGYNNNTQQQQYQPQFSTPPPLPTNRSVNQYGARARSISPGPSGSRSKSPGFIKTGAPLTPNYGAPLKPAPKAPKPVPRPAARKAAPRRSLSAPMSPARDKSTINPGGPVSPEELKKHVIQAWALEPPRLIKIKPLVELIRTIDTIFPPRLHMIPDHAYFHTWKPITPGEYHQANGVSKIVRKVRVFLHPDKLPRDFTPDQILLCKLLWDIINDTHERQYPDK